MKKLSRFKRAFRGYDVKETDEYIALMQSLRDEEQRSLNMKADILKEEIVELKRSLREKTAREEEVTSAIIAAIERAKETEEAWSKRYALELERIRIFRSKWEAYIEENKLKLPAKDRCDKVAAHLFTDEAELITMMKEGLKLDAEPKQISAVNAQYMDESKRLLEKIKSASPVTP